MDIIEINNNWRDEVLNIDINLGNYCNYKCWYCWPGSNDGTRKFPNVDVMKRNITHLINHYIKNSNKRVFDIHFCGGEPSHWPKLIEFVTFLKSNYDCLISMTTNASKSMQWWEKAAPYFDRVHVSCHREYSDVEHLKTVCDYLYTKNVVASVSVMMDPRAWDQCMNIVGNLKTSKKRWTIRYVEIIDPTIDYTLEQKQVLEKFRARKPNIFWFLKNNKYYISKVTAIDSNNKKHRLEDNEVLLRRLNNFYGWSCSVGVNWLNINNMGIIAGTCNQKLYGESEYYNLYDPDFPKKFNPKLQYAVCEQTSCVCSVETVMHKFKNASTKKFIPLTQIT